MPTHRANNHPPERAAAPARTGRRRSADATTEHESAPRARRLPSRSSVLGAGALLVVVAVGATAGHVLASPTAGTAAATTAVRDTPDEVRSQSQGAASGPSLSAPVARRIDRVSRSTKRPALSAEVTSRQQARDQADLTSAAERQADVRSDRLKTTADAARSYAKVLTSDEWTLPTTGFHISTWFGESGPYWSSGYHTGIDFATAYGTPVVAVANAKVAQTGWDGAYGNQIRLQFTNGDQVWYNHLSAIEVSVGQQVQRGQRLGRVGETGNAYGAHLHFEYRLASDLHTGVDPLPFLNKHGIHLR